MLPLATDFVDFPQRFLDALHALGQIYHWDPAQLAERITADAPTCSSPASTRR